jgi:nucleoside-diphosphate-sugar epimerase
MKNVYITGENGFIGSNILKYFSNTFNFIFYNRNEIDLNNIDIVFHFAGKAHDFDNKNISDYYLTNTELTKKLFDSYLRSSAKTFIFLSSVKAVADSTEYELTENHVPSPFTHYGKSKLLAEQYILNSKISKDKRFFILRPCMIHGPGNKGNLNSLFQVVNYGIPWPLGRFFNKRSFCSVENLCFIINELIHNQTIPSGIYNIADDDPISTNKIIELISSVVNKRRKIINIPPIIIKIFARFGDFFNLPFNSFRLKKLTENYVVSNKKIKTSINKSLPISSENGLLNTFKSFYRK